jgi:hypothetical protein
LYPQPPSISAKSVTNVRGHLRIVLVLREVETTGAVAAGARVDGRGRKAIVGECDSGFGAKSNVPLRGFDDDEVLHGSFHLFQPCLLQHTVDDGGGNVNARLPNRDCTSLDRMVELAVAASDS